MAQDNLEIENSQENIVFQKAKESIKSGQKSIGRDLLTNLLKSDPKNVDYWIWLSAAMETKKEQVYCLQAAYKLDPTNQAANRGLSILSEIPSGTPSPAFPVDHPNLWEENQKSADIKKLPRLDSLSEFRLAIFLGVVILVLIGVIVTFGPLMRSNSTNGNTADLLTPRPTVTPQPTFEHLNPQGTGVRPLSDLVSVPYTLTPIYALTPHADAASDSFRGAMKAYNDGQMELAGVMMAQVATAQPGSADSIYFVGETYRLSGKHKEAIKYYNQAISVNPKYAPSYLGRARSNIALNNMKSVINDLNMAVLLDPNYDEAFLERGAYYLAAGDINSAHADLDHALSLEDNPLVELNLAKLYIAQKENGAAVVAAKRANRMDLTMLDGYLVLGMAYQADNELDQAIQEINIYLNYRTDNPEAYTILGSIYYARGEYKKAEENFSNALLINPKYDNGFIWLGKTYIATNQKDKALEILKKARDITPNSFDLNESLAQTYMAMGKYNNSYTTIIKIEKLAVTPQQRARFLFIRAFSLDQMGNYLSAARDWNEILNMPADAVNDEMRATASQKLVSYTTPTP
ncbi:MAG: tetratricopeptide repeat protein [Chloroflexota bacterium]